MKTMEVVKSLATTNLGKVMLAKPVCEQDQSNVQYSVIKLSSLHRLNKKTTSSPDNPYNEAKTLITLNQGPNAHPGYKHIIKFHGETVTERYHLLAMEYAENGSLFDFISENICNEDRNQPRLVNDATLKMYFRELLSGMQYVHRMNKCHLDIKPENILLDKDMHLKICDFGAARQMMIENGRYKKLKGKVGTIPYMAPEVYSKGIFDGQQADIYSIGVVFFLMLTGFLPYTKPSKKDKRFAMIYNGQIRKLLNDWGILHQISEGALDMLSKMLCPSKNRYTSVDQIMAHPWLAITGTSPVCCNDLGNHELSSLEISLLCC